MRKAEDQKSLVKIAERLPEEGQTSKGKRSRIVAFEDDDLFSGGGTRTNGAGVTKKSAAAGAGGRSGKGEKGSPSSGNNAKAKAKRAKARQPNEKITPASIFKKMIAFGKAYQVEKEQDFLEAARIYAEEAGLIDQMRDQIAEEGLTVMKTYKTGDVPVAHPLLSELPRHVESANKCLSTIGSMVSERGAKKERAERDLDAFRLHR